MPSLSLTGPQKKRFGEALRSAFPTPEGLEELLSLRLDRPYVDLVPRNANYKHAVFKVIESAEEEGWTAELLEAALADNPRNDLLQRFARQLGRGGPPDQPTLVVTFDLPTRPLD